jgi:hypothetical protein
MQRLTSFTLLPTLLCLLMPHQSVAMCDPETEFSCANGDCVDIFWKCDAFDDCGDLSDEPRSCNTTCREGEIMCPHTNGVVICIEQNWMCDDDVDCPGGWDEDRSAHNCSIGEFALSIYQMYTCTLWTCHEGVWKVRTYVYMPIV